MFISPNSPQLVGLSEQDSKNLLGGKGSGLAFMAANGVNVPPFLVLPTTLCADYTLSPTQTMQQIKDELHTVYSYMTSKFGYMPLLSVRSGARVSMPGMMDTILNVGLSPKTMEAWEQRLGSPDCVADSYKRLVVMYGNVVGGYDRKLLEHDTLPETLAAYSALSGSPFPDVEDQLLHSIEAVFKSWNNERAKVYRKMNDIPGHWGTAVVIQAMVFGNMNDQSGTGVLFTRNPDTGEDVVVGEFLVNAQGEDVVAGVRTPLPLTQFADWNSDVAAQLIAEVTKLEELKRDVQDVEFTVQDGTLYILQTRNAKRSARAAVRIAYDMITSGFITKDEGLSRVSEREIDLSQVPTISPTNTVAPMLKGIPACAGIKTGVVALTSASASAMAASGASVILVTEETTPDDIVGMVASKAVLTMTGGSTSHAAVVARSMNLTCVVGAGLDHLKLFTPGMTITVDGSTGNVYPGEVQVVGGVNTLVTALRSMKAGMSAHPILIQDVPDYDANTFILNVSDLLHFGAEYIIDLVWKVKARCTTLQGYVRFNGASSFWMPQDDLIKVMDAVAAATTGVTWFGHTTPFLEPGETTLESLVLATKGGIFLQSIAKTFGSDTSPQAVKWVLSKKEAEGVVFKVWETDHKVVEYQDLG